MSCYSHYAFLSIYTVSCLFKLLLVFVLTQATLMCEHFLKDIRFYLKTEQCERGGKIAPFLAVKTNLNENRAV